MRVELRQVPSIHADDEAGIPGRTVWDVFATDEERATLARVAERLVEEPDAFELDGEELRALAWAVEVVQLVVRREERPASSDQRRTWS